MDKESKNRTNGCNVDKEIEPRDFGTDLNYQHKYQLHPILFYTILNLGALIGTYHFFFAAKWMTLVWCEYNNVQSSSTCVSVCVSEKVDLKICFFFLNIQAIFQGFLSGQGVVLGSHRGYSHKSYKASKTLQCLLIFFHTMSGQVSISIS